jgi:hypothetical protein
MLIADSFACSVDSRFPAAKMYFRQAVPIIHYRINNIISTVTCMGVRDL